MSDPSARIEDMFDGSLPGIGDFSALSDAELVAASAGWGRAENAAAARKLAAMAELFRRRTGCDTATDRHNWFVDPDANAVSELAAAHNITERLAMFQTHRAVALADRLPHVAALFTAGLITDLLVRAIVTRTALITDPTLMAAVDTDLAAQITSWGPQSEKKTFAAIDAIVETHDPGALRRVKDAENDRGLQFGFISDAAGFMTVWARMYAPDGAAFEQRVTDMAHTVWDEDPRTADERRNDALAAVATGTHLRCECPHPDCPGNRDTQPTKDVVVHIVTTEETLDAARTQTETQPEPEAEPHAETEPQHEPEAEDEAQPEPEAEPQAEPEPEPEAEAGPTPEAEAEATPEPEATPEAEAAPLAEAATQPPSAPQQSACRAPAFVIGAGVTNPTVLAAFLHRARLRTIQHPGNAPPEPHYRPSAALQDFVRCRDLTCRFPGCDAPATRCDIDHTVPWPAGPTCAANLKCLCRKHHLLKTFWTGENGWRDEQFADGTIVWTSPSGQTYTTRPGSALLFPTLCTPTADVPIQPTKDTTTDRGLKMPKRRRTRAQNRARRIQEERRLNDDLVAERNKPPPF
ncbi:HNH endonuclease [Mycolicibacterium monacense DSM 44395]|nr:HNH endonuclease [Mycolicibacterium monacense DSM 44395]